MSFTLHSSAFTEGERLPYRHMAEGGNVSPELLWYGWPAGVQSFALVMHDPDAPEGDFTHWLLWDIPASSSSLSEGAGTTPGGATGRNSFGEILYHGPAPPPGDGPHRYYFALYALAAPRLGLPSGSERKEFDEAVKFHLVDTARLMVLCGRPVVPAV